MKIIKPGYIYELDNVHPDPNNIDDSLAQFKNTITFVNREEIPHSGTLPQEVLRMLIDKTCYYKTCLGWKENNNAIIYHLRMALILYEATILIQKVENCGYMPEEVKIASDGNFCLTYV